LGFLPLLIRYYYRRLLQKILLLYRLCCFCKFESFNHLPYKSSIKSVWYVFIILKITFSSLFIQELPQPIFTVKSFSLKDGAPKSTINMWFFLEDVFSSISKYSLCFLLLLLHSI